MSRVIEASKAEKCGTTAFAHVRANLRIVRHLLTGITLVPLNRGIGNVIADVLLDVLPPTIAQRLFIEAYQQLSAILENQNRERAKDFVFDLLDRVLDTQEQEFLICKLKNELGQSNSRTQVSRTYSKRFKAGRF